MKEDREFVFNKDHQAWVGDFADYPEGEEEFYELAWGWENITSHINYRKGIYLSGNNHSDDLFMFIKRPIQDLKANTLYAITFSVDLASNVPEGNFGVGGAEGEAVYVKVGASTIEPKREGFSLNVDKGNQQTGGKNAVVVGNLANSLVDPHNRQYERLNVNNFNNPLLVKSNDKGDVWVFVGTDSGFEGPTKFYIGKVQIHFEEK
jgi:hypothetical protein